MNKQVSMQLSTRQAMGYHTLTSAILSAPVHEAANAMVLLQPSTGFSGAQHSQRQGSRLTSAEEQPLQVQQPEQQQQQPQLPHHPPPPQQQQGNLHPFVAEQGPLVGAVFAGDERGRNLFELRGVPQRARFNYVYWHSASCVWRVILSFACPGQRTFRPRL